MKIYGHPWSINTRKALMAAEEKGHPLSLALVMLPKGEHRQPEHLARHPFGKVPVLDDDGFVLYETRAINRYLDARLDGPPLIPAEPRARARMEQWLNVADAYFVPHAHAAIVELVFRRYLGGAQDRAAIDGGLQAIGPALAVLDRALSSTPFLVGDALSLADLHFAPYLEYLQQTGHDGPIRAHASVAAWWARVSARPSWQRVARSGPQPYAPETTADVVEKQHR